MQLSKLDEMYSLSSICTGKELIEKMPGIAKNNLDVWIALNEYIDQYTNKVRNELAILRDKCPLCDSKDFTFLFDRHGFDHMFCNSCELIFTHQILDLSKIKYMDKGDEGDAYGDYKENSTVNEFDRKKFQIVFELIEKYGDVKRIFDFGSQSGTFMDWAKEKYSIVGHEYHTPLRKRALAKGHTVLNDGLETIRLDGEFDLITCWDYLDHVLNPKSVIKNLSKYLKKGGLFFFAINNRDALSVRMLHQNSPIFVGPHHTMHYGPKQLNLLMEDFELLHSESYVSEFSWISNWLNFKNPESGDAKLMKELFDPKRICELGMGFKVNSIYRKN